MGILKDQLKNSSLGLKGTTPATREGANPASQLHAQGSNPTGMQSSHSIHDLDGKTPEGYKAPERGIDHRLRDLTD